MPFCSRCGTESLEFHRFCISCGEALAAAATQPQRPLEASEEIDYVIPPARVLLLTVLTYGLYLLYWGYVTWKHYRDHAGGQHFPVWHTLSFSVPIYGFFRFHAHIRSFKELMDTAGIGSTLNPGSAVALIIVSYVVTIISGLVFDLVSDPESGMNIAVFILMLDLLSIGIVAAVLNQAQDNLNRYWTALAGGRWSEAKIGKGEVIFSLLGILLWADTLANIFSAGYRGS